MRPNQEALYELEGKSATLRPIASESVLTNFVVSFAEFFVSVRERRQKCMAVGEISNGDTHNDA